MQIKGKTALITGANGGIGQALVTELLARGAQKVYAAVRNEQSAAALTQLNSDRIALVVLDITDETAVSAAAARCEDIDILINNAGCNRLTPFGADTAGEASRQEMEINYFGTLAMCQAFAPQLQTRGGAVIATVCSILGMVNLPANGTYCASKAAVHSMIQGLRAELGQHDIRVVGIYPGPVDTPMTAGQEMPKSSAPDVADAICSGIESGEEDIFPDQMSKEVSAMLKKDAKAVEKEFSTMLPS